MRRELSAYLNDILEAAIAIQEATATEDETTYGTNRLVRSSVERELIIGEALKVIERRAPEQFAAISEARQIIDFRNLLTHEYLNISDRVVWGAIQTDLPVLVQHCEQLLQ